MCSKTHESHLSPRPHPHLTLPELAHRVWNHPRRLGFVLFNVGMIAAIVVWGVATEELKGEGLAAAPMAILGIAGTAVLIGLLVAVWVVWAIFLIWRHRPHRD